jgi:hypothetical protein
MPREGTEVRLRDPAQRLRADAAQAFVGRNRITTLDLVERAATVPGLSAVDFNFPDHLEGLTPRELRDRLDALGLGLNGFAMRYYSDPGFKLGALSHPDRAVRQKALDLTLRGLDALAEAGGDLMTLWLGQDGFDYPFQADYGALLGRLRGVAPHRRRPQSRHRRLPRVQAQRAARLLAPSRRRDRRS